MSRAKRAAPDVFRPLAKGDRIRAAYVYADGHVVVGFEREIRDVGGSRVTYYKQAERLAPGFACCFTEGRIYFASYSGVTALRAMLRAGARAIGCRPISVDNGSEATKARAMPIGSVTFECPEGDVTFYQLPHIHTGMEVQTDVSERFNPTCERWGYSERDPMVETIRDAAGGFMTQAEIDKAG